MTFMWITIQNTEKKLTPYTSSEQVNGLDGLIQTQKYKPAVTLKTSNMSYDIKGKTEP